MNEMLRHKNSFCAKFEIQCKSLQIMYAHLCRIAQKLTLGWNPVFLTNKANIKYKSIHIIYICKSRCLKGAKGILASVNLGLNKLRPMSYRIKVPHDWGV